MLSEVTRNYRAFFKVAKVKHSELRKSTAHLKHTPLLKTTGSCILRLANNGFLTAHVVLLSNTDKLLSNTSLTTIANHTTQRQQQTLGWGTYNVPSAEFPTHCSLTSPNNPVQCSTFSFPGRTNGDLPTCPRSFTR